MDFRPLGDGMSCVAVAMPHAALEEGTTDAAPELRRICAVVGGGHEGTKKRGPSPDRLPITPDDNVGEAERRVTNQKGMRGAKGGWAGGRRERLRLWERRTGRGLSEQTSCREEAQGTASACKVVSLFQHSDSASVETLSAGGVKLVYPAANMLARPCTMARLQHLSVHHHPLAPQTNRRPGSC
ncbi:hypothetical protein IG631_15013 [Alternaria alternata]|nr:hypothetical protein IG631_15013 [Alternaria alternata]